MGDHGDENIDYEKLLLDLIRNTLEKNKDLSKTRCEMRLKVLEVIRGGANLPMNDQTSDRQAATQLMNSLILEYLQWYGYQYTIEMFSTETGCKPLDRDYLESKINTPEQTDKDLPLLLELVIKTMKNSN
ncbi:unnamed protein product [Diamesa hyperborea]